MIRLYLFLKLSTWFGRRVKGAFSYLLMVFLVFWAGVPDKADQIATWWAIQNRSPEDVYWIYRVFAWASIIVGWIIMAFATVAILRLIF
jgi:hypothetical protein